MICLARNSNQAFTFHPTFHSANPIGVYRCIFRFTLPRVSSVLSFSYLAWLPCRLSLSHPTAGRKSKLRFFHFSFQLTARQKSIFPTSLLSRHHRMRSVKLTPPFIPSVALRQTVPFSGRVL